MEAATVLGGVSWALPCLAASGAAVPVPALTAVLGAAG